MDVRRSQKDKKIHFRTPQEAGEYFDTHTADEFWDRTRPAKVTNVKGKVRLSLELSGPLGKRLIEQSHQSNLPMGRFVSQCLTRAMK